MGLFERAKQKILVVEDEPDIAESVEVRLELAGYEVVLARNGQEGVLKARAEKPDLIILDIMMPKLNGFEMCEILRGEKEFKHTPFLFLTARQAIGDVDRAFEIGASDYLSKPFSNESLITKIKKLLP